MVLRRCLFDGGKRKAAARRAWQWERALGCYCLGLRRRRLRVGAARARVHALNRGGGGSRACGPEMDYGGVKPDLSSSLGLARGKEEGPDRRAPPISAREGRREGACATGWAGALLLGRMRGRRKGKEGRSGQAVRGREGGEGGEGGEAVGRAARGEKRRGKRKGKMGWPK
jgi:hypothetical protein